LLISFIPSTQKLVRVLSEYLFLNSLILIIINKSKESRPIVDPALVCGEGPGFGLPPGSGLCITLLGSTYLWSVGVMEYWKNEIPTPIFCNFIQRPSRFSDT